MMVERKKKLKVAMLCQYSNERLRTHMSLSDFSITNRIRSLFKVQKLKYSDNAPWITNIISHFEDSPRELHVIAPHIGMKKNYESFMLNGVCYHFFRNRPSVAIKGLFRRFFPHVEFRFKHNSGIVQKVISKIQPDIVLLIGVEDPSYSKTILNITGIPILVLAQTILQDPEFAKTMNSSQYHLQVRLEQMIFNKTPYVGVYSQHHYSILSSLGFNGHILGFSWPNNKNDILTNPPFSQEKEYDFINFATRMTDEKGYPDSIKALALVKKKYHNVKLNLIDTGSPSEKSKLLTIIEENGLENNVSFTPFFESREDLFKHIQKSRFGVLPCKVDYFSGTMLQCMRYGIPIAVYETSGTPALNRDAECVLIAAKNDVKQLADKMILLMDDDNLAQKLRDNSFEFIRRQNVNNERKARELFHLIDAVIENFTLGKQIPQECYYCSL